jgi:uncharacterized membrane protein YhaH (DUF805 family)
MEWMFMPLRKYADFSGRARRKEFWMFFLLNFIVSMLLFVLLFASLPWSEMMAASQAQQAGMPYGGPQPEPGAMFFFVFAIYMLWVLVTLLPTLAVSVRRLHDQDKSGWFYLLNFVPFGGIVLIVFYFMEGTRGPNQYGPDPKGHVGADTFG